MTIKYDCTYYWNGGTEYGEWRRADPGLREVLRKQGYVAHNGLSTIGAPVGPPELSEINSVLRPYPNLKNS